MWKNVIGQERVKKIIRQTLESGKLPNAYLFTGAEGVGKDAGAIELAKTLNCLNPISGTDFSPSEACDECANCKSIGSLASPLLHFVFALAKDSGKEEKSEGD